MIKEKLQKIKEKLEEIIIPDGIDKGLILKSWDNPTYWDEERQISMYKYENFCELGDALIELHEMIEDVINGCKEIPKEELLNMVKHEVDDKIKVFTELLKAYIIRE